MKSVKLLLMTIVMIASYSLTAQIAITNDGTPPDGSAMLDVKSTDKGILMPRLTQTEIEAIVNPAVGLIVFNTNDNRFYFFDGGANEWKEMAIGAGIIQPVEPVPTVTNPTTGRIWMDRNLGASQVATSSTDAAAYGDIYQWGRAADGHESRTSSVIYTNATTAVPNDGNVWDGLFIPDGSYPNDWLTPQDNTLWQGEAGTNNPCPEGFRIPTAEEWEAERQSWATSDLSGAFGSPLKLTASGMRRHNNGGHFATGGEGYYWCYTVNGPYVKFLRIYIPGQTIVSDASRSGGMSVRCIKD